MANRYWIGGSGDWNDTAHWSTTSGGAGGSAMPTSSDDVFFDNNSRVGTTTINLLTTRSVARIDSSGLSSGTITINSALGSHSVYSYGAGDHKFNNLVDVGYYYFYQTAGATVNVYKPGSLAVKGFGTATNAVTINLMTDLLGIGYLSITKGTFNTNGYAVTSTGYIYFQSTGVINLGSSIITVTYYEADSSVTINASTSEIVVTGNSSYFRGGGRTYYKVTLSTGGIGTTRTISGSNTIDTFTVLPSITAAFTSGTTQTINTVVLTGTSVNAIRLQSATPGSTWTISKASGTVNGTYLNISDSIATGGATWNATTSTNSGNNTGWNFIGPQPPSADFSYTPASIWQSQSVSFTDTSANTPTSWLWDFGDATTSTSQNPTHQYTTSGTYTVSLTATNGVGGDTETKTSIITVTLRTFSLSFVSTASENGDSNMVSETGSLSVVGFEQSLGRLIVLTNYQALAQKDYEYRVFDHNWNFIGIWRDVTSEFSYDQSINQNATELNVEVSRSPNNLAVSYTALLDNLGGTILDNNSTPILVPTETANAVGVGTDIDYNYNVQVLVFYGGYESLLDEFSDPILDNMGEQILVPYGFPNGKVVYSGYISDYTLNYGENVGVDVVVVPHATEMQHQVFKSGLNTTVTYGSLTDPVQMAQDAMAQYVANGGVIQYSNSSMPLTGEQAPYEFNLQTIREVIDKVVDLLPSGYYQYADPGDNIQYILEKSATPDHIFYYEQHIKVLKLRRSITQLVNQVYFVGGNIAPPDTTEVSLFKYYEDLTSIGTIRPGLERISDSRVTTDLGAQILAQNKINQFKDPRYRTSVEISDGDFDIETIKLGQSVGFKNFGSFVDDLVLQIVTIHRRKHTVILDLDMNIPGEAKRIEEIKKALLSQDVSNIPSTPS